MPELEVICEDGPLLGVNKPSGLIAQGAPEGVVSLPDMVRDYLKKKYNKPGNVYLGIPHRLDRPVSGVTVFSRNSKCAARLSEQFAKRTVEKTYLAILESIPEKSSGRLENWIYRIPNESRVVIRDADSPGAKIARLRYRVLETSKKRALVEVDLETGRMHQIRVQFANIGCPVYADTKYGANSSMNDPNAIALHAFRMKLKHPVRYDDVIIEAPIPRSWNSLGF
ncbi:Ribosomal large subunit pseudouridine synthase D [Thalassoglobus neptunius]|uniref:Ribosomal large subunit pseudouridine synthase D n=1 Tax=Thalassoglobus neptunius TaxID=1938619 RepID=A0A5C5WXF9_9PLAN|nr:RNA pseudouridine synthase [Thalassoglobus neptunius]TWT55260.1 Ribosomal large subunit pseudouridine synthase D [Thalassoglobus neptunius]